MSTITLLLTGIAFQASSLIDSREATLLGYTERVQPGREHRRPGDYTSGYSATNGNDGSRLHISVRVRDRSYKHPWDDMSPQNPYTHKEGAISGLPIAGVSVYLVSGIATSMTSVNGSLFVNVSIDNSPRRVGGRMERNPLSDPTKAKELVEGIIRTTIATHVGQSLIEANSLGVNGKQVNVFKNGSKTFLDWTDLVAAKTGSGQANTRLGTWSGKVGNHTVLVALASDKIKVDGAWHDLGDPIARKGQKWLVSSKALAALSN